MRGTRIGKCIVPRRLYNYQYLVASTRRDVYLKKALTEWIDELNDRPSYWTNEQTYRVTYRVACTRLKQTGKREMDPT